MGAKIMRTNRQQKNHEAYLRAKQRMINYLNQNEIIVFFVAGLLILGMVGALAVALA